MSELPAPVEMGVLAHGGVLHILDGKGDHSWERVALCRTKGTLENHEEDIDPRAIRVRGRDVCRRCSALATERRPAGVAPGRSSVGRDDPGHLTERKENDMPTQARKKATATRRRSTRKTTAAKPAATTKPKVEKAEAKEKGQAIFDALLKAVKAEGVEFDVSPNKSETYMRLRVDGKAFAYVFPPRPTSVAVKIPKQLLGVEKSLAKGHGFKRTDWGLTRTLATAQDAPIVAKAFAVAAASLKPKAEPAPAAKEADVDGAPVYADEAEEKVEATS